MLVTLAVGMSLMGLLPVTDGLPELTDADDKTAENVRAAYAQALLDLAQYELQRATERSKSVAGSVPAVTLERLKLNVEIAEQLQKLSKQKERSQLVDAQLRHARARANLAESRLQVAKLSKQRQPESVGESELELLRLQARVANLRLEMWRHPENLTSLLETLQWH